MADNWITGASNDDLDDLPLLTPEQLVSRYNQRITQKTLRNWRNAQKGPPFVKVGSRVFYRVADVEKWEAKRTVGVFRYVSR